MKSRILSTRGALIALGPASSSHVEGKPATVFSCTIGKNIASVTLAGRKLTCRFATRAQDEAVFAAGWKQPLFASVE